MVDPSVGYDAFRLLKVSKIVQKQRIDRTINGFFISYWSVFLISGKSIKCMTDVHKTNIGFGFTYLHP